MTVDDSRWQSMAVDDSLWQCSMYDIVIMGISNYVASTTYSKHDECWHPLAPFGTLWHPREYGIVIIGKHGRDNHVDDPSFKRGH